MIKLFKIISSRLFIHFIIVLVSVNSFAQSSSEDYKTDLFIGQKIKQSKIVGLAGLIIVDKKVVWSKGYGFSDVENKIPFLPTTIINIASISKTITGTCLMQVVESGKLNLDEDINKYLPFLVRNLHFPNDKITLRQLATHTSSIVDQEAYAKSYHFGGDSPDSLGSFLKSYLVVDGLNYRKENFQNSKPGYNYEYSNMGAALAGYIIELATGEQLSHYSRHSLFEPLKMNSTGYFLSEINKDLHSRLYHVNDDTVSQIELYGLTTYPDGGVRTSVEDLAKFFIAMLSIEDSTEVLNRKSIDEMMRPQFNEVKKPSNIKLNKENSGIFWSIERNGTWIGHDGGDPGVNTIMFYDLSKQVGVILFVNTSFDNEKKGDKIIASISNRLLKFGLSIRKEYIDR
jgi:CubicO group peptidase (beta-lactamase class C family)